MSSALSIAETILEHAAKNGADQADVMISKSQTVSASCRLQKRESIERSESRDIGLRVFIGKRQAMISSSDENIDTLKELTDQAISMARAVPEDPYCGIVDDPKLLSTMNAESLDLFDKTEVDIDTLLQEAIIAEDAAREIEGITNSEGADIAATKASRLYATSAGFSGQSQSSSHSLSVSVIGGKGEHMQRDYDYSVARHLNKRKPPEEIGKSAGQRAVSRLNPRKVKTQNVPVVYAPRVSRSLLSHLWQALSGNAIARGTSMLKDKMGQNIFANNITIYDDPFLVQGLASKAFDGEGLLPQKRAIIENGVLTGWILDSRSARKLGLQSTGNAQRSASSSPAPHPHNFYMENGALPPEDLIKDIKDGFYVTEMMGSSVSLLTGDYSRGAAGFWIENGEIAYPVSEVTIAGNLNDMWSKITAAYDLLHEQTINAPTLRIENMVVAGD